MFGEDDSLFSPFALFARLVLPTAVDALLASACLIGRVLFGNSLCRRGSMRIRRIIVLALNDVAKCADYINKIDFIRYYYKHK